MSRHARRVPVLALLARLGWQRDPGSWRVRGRDQFGRPVVLRIGLSVDGVTVTSSAAGLVTINPLQVGRLRAALRDAVETTGRLRGDIETRQTRQARQARQTDEQQRAAGTAPGRRRIAFPLPRRPSVADVAARIGQESTSIGEADECCAVDPCRPGRVA